MNKQDVNLIAVQLVAEALGDLRAELVLVGGCAVGLLITDEARPPIRATDDVDLVAEVSSRQEYYALSDRLRARGFTEDGDVICRWAKGRLLLDVMPTDEGILGFSNRWYEEAVRTSSNVDLPNGLQVRVASAPLLIATKLDSFHSRANGDYAHHDMEDIVSLVDGRPELASEIESSSDALRSFIKEEIEDLLLDPLFLDRIPWLLANDEASQQRVPLVVERLRRLAGL
jgi:predicted nucleotidyltransferase